jgi:hypothetical protein
VVLAGARHGDDMVWALLDAVEAPGMSVRPVRLAALDASATVELTWDRYTVRPERIVAVEPYRDWLLRDRAGLAGNGYLAIGVAARGARILGSDALTSEVDQARGALDESTPATVVEARAAASLLAVRAATAVVAAGGGRSMEAGSTAARLMREATFLLVFGQTPEIRAAQRAALSVEAP